MKNQKITTQTETEKKRMSKHDLASIAKRENQFNKNKIVTK